MDLSIGFKQLYLPAGEGLTTKINSTFTYLVSGIRMAAEKSVQANLRQCKSHGPNTLLTYFRVSGWRLRNRFVGMGTVLRTDLFQQIRFITAILANALFVVGAVLVKAGLGGGWISQPAAFAPPVFCVSLRDGE